MAENTPETPSVDETADVEVKQNFIAKFAAKHPRAAKVIAIAGGTVAALGIANTVSTVAKNRAHLNAASDHAKETIRELSDAVSPTDTDV